MATTDQNRFLADLLLKLGQSLGGQAGGAISGAKKVASSFGSPLAMGAGVGSSIPGILSPTDEANQVVAEEAQKTVRKAVRGRVESLIQQGVDPTKILETTVGFGVRDGAAQKKGGQESPTATATAKQAPAQTSPAKLNQPIQQPSPQQTAAIPTQDNNELGNMLQVLLSHVTGIPTPGAIDFFRQEKLKTASQAQDLGIKGKIKEAESVPLGRARKEELGIQSAVELQKAQMKEAMELAKNGRLSGDKLFEKFETASKSFIEVRDGYARLRNALEDPATGKLDFTGANPASDLDLLFGTAKTLDPGGRVTDSDIAIQQMATGAYGDRWKRIAQKFQRKGFLAPDERKALFNAATARFEAAQTQQAKTVNQFSTLAQRQGINPQDIFRDVGIAGNQQTQAQSSGGIKVLSIEQEQ